MFTIGGTVFSPDGFDAAQQGDLSYGISEKLPLWGKPGLNRKSAAAEVFKSHAELDFQSRQVQRDLTKQLLETALAQRIVEIGEQDLAWLRTTATAVESKYRSGQTDAADTLQIQNEVANRDAYTRKLAGFKDPVRQILNGEITPFPIRRLDPAL